MVMAMNNFLAKKTHITLWFNVALTSYYLANEVGNQLIKPLDQKKNYLDIMFPDGSIGLLAVTLLLMLVFGTILVREFWCRFIADIFSLRSITTQEAYSLLLICMLIFNAP